MFAVCAGERISVERNREGSHKSRRRIRRKRGRGEGAYEREQIVVNAGEKGLSPRRQPSPLLFSLLCCLDYTYAGKPKDNVCTKLESIIPESL